MYKTRTIQQPDFGYYQDNLYFGRSEGPWLSNPDRYFSQVEMVSRLRNSPRTSAISCPAFIGKESFESSEYHKPRWNDCSHFVSGRFVNKLHGRYFDTGRVFGLDRQYYHEPCWRQDYRSSYNALFALPIGGFDAQFSARAWWTMQPRIKSKVSIINSLIEMKDFQLLSKAFVKAYRGNEGFFRRFEKDVRKTVDPTVPFAQGVLTLNLAIRPLINDVSNIISQAQVHVLEAINEFSQDGESPRTSHYSEETIEKQSITAYNNYQNVVTGYASDTRRTASYQHTFSYRPEGAYAEFAKYWGLGLTPEAIWNALPFSFVVDYISTMGKSIQRMTLQKGVTVDEYQYAESVLNWTKGGYFVHHPKGYIVFNDKKLSTSSPKHIAGLETTSYVRKVTRVNKGPALPQFKQMSSTQLLNTFALLRVLF